jgi:hypothetical protein
MRERKRELVERRSALGHFSCCIVGWERRLDAERSDEQRRRGGGETDGIGNRRWRTNGGELRPDG